MDGVQAIIFPKTTHFVSSKWAIIVDCKVAIDPYWASLDRSWNRVGHVQVLSHNDCCQSISSVVGPLYRLLNSPICTNTYYPNSISEIKLSRGFWFLIFINEINLCLLELHECQYRPKYFIFYKLHVLLMAY